VEKTKKAEKGAGETTPKSGSDRKLTTKQLFRLGMKAVAPVAPKLSDLLRNATLQLMTNLNFSHCELITSEGLKKLANVGLAHLAFLDFSFCAKLTDEGVDALIFSCGQRRGGTTKKGMGPGLKSLRLRGCEKLTKAAFKSFSITDLDFRSLFEVDLALNPLLGDDALECFRIDGFPNLLAIDFSRTFGQSKAVEEDKNGDPVLYDNEKEDRCFLDQKTGKIKRLTYPLGVTNKGLEHVNKMREKASKNISVLKFEHCATIDDKGFENLRSFQFLTVLSIGGTNIGNASIKNICESFSRLQSLDIEYCDITDEGLAHFAADTVALKETLRFLNFRECDKITDDGLKHLRNLIKLERLSFHGCDKFKKVGMVHVTGGGHLKHLRKLDVGSSGKKMEELGDEGLVELHKSEHLVDLNLSGTKITNRAIHILRGSKEITKTGIGALRNLLSLNLSWTRISDEGLLHLEDACSKDDAHLKLKHISLKGCRLVTDIGLDHVLAATANTIEELNVAFVPHVTNTSMKKIRDRELPKLRYLNLSFTKVSDRGVLMVSERGLPNLEDLVMAGCSKLTAECAADFGRTKSLRRVKSLNFFGCKYINDETVMALKNAQLPYLVSMNMGFTGITESTRTILASRKSFQLKSLDINKCNLEGHGKKFNFIHALKKVMAEEEREEKERERKEKSRLTDANGQLYRVETRVEHNKRGKGTVVDINEEKQKIFVTYDSGHEHSYDQISLGTGKITVHEEDNKP
jgi:Leucine-rich repeat (LRR) protein